jgi:hypothetical protein
MRLMLLAAAALLEPLEATEVQELTVCWTTLLAAPAAAQEVVLALRQDLVARAAILAAVVVAALLRPERLTQAQVATVATGSCVW